MNEMRIYVASLYDYNDGRLEGKWLDLADYANASELMESIQEMLDDLTKKYKNIDGEVREEFAVHDYEGIPSTLASEYMGEQDFQQLYDIAEVAEDRGIPVEVLVERAGDTGSDDYQALADSLMFVVNGNDEKDIVSEYEDQLGGLGNDFWSNHIYIDDVTERVIYGEDVDRFREDILYENPEMDEAEAEAEAERMADAEAEMREDLPSYLDEMGYGDEIPSFVSKDYEGAWKRSLSYDLDVIHHDGEMYVFSNNYGVGGSILSGLVGAYIGYKIGRARPQKIGFGTEIRIGNSVKDKIKSKIAQRRASKKKKMATGGGIGFKALSAKVAKRYEGKKPQAKYRGEYGKRYSRNEAKEVGDKVAGKIYAQQRAKFAGGGGVENVRVIDLGKVTKVVGDYNFAKIIHYTDAENLRAIYPRGYVVYFYKADGTYIKSGLDKYFQYENEYKDALQYAKENVNNIDNEKYAKGGGVDDIEEGDIVKVKSEGGLKAEVIRIVNDFANVEFVNRRPNGGDKTGRYKLNDLKLINEEYAQGGGVSGLNDLIRG